MYWLGWCFELFLLNKILNRVLVNFERFKHVIEAGNVLADPSRWWFPVIFHFRLIRFCIFQTFLSFGCCYLFFVIFTIFFFILFAGLGIGLVTLQVGISFTF